MPSNGSMAVWCQSRGGAPCSSAEVHFNYWRLASQARFIRRARHLASDFAEVGIFLDQPNCVESVSIYLPLPLESQHVRDCGQYFSDVEIAQGIFNEPLTCNSAGPPGPQRVELLRPTGAFCRVHRFVANPAGDLDANHVEIAHEVGGTLLTITRQAIDEVCIDLPEGCPAYFRLRAYLPKDGVGPFVSVISPRDRRLQTGFDEVEYIDFRLNEARTLPTRIENLMRTQQARRVAFRLVAFLTAVPVASDLTASSQEAHKKRLLEHDLWNDYVPSGLPAGMMVYHWRKEEADGVEDFSAFVKLRTRRSDRRIVITALVFAFVFAVLGNLAAWGIQAAASALVPP